jgi:hypothetical protein
MAVDALMLASPGPEPIRCDEENYRGRARHVRLGETRNYIRDFNTSVASKIVRRPYDTARSSSVRALVLGNFWLGMIAYASN